MFDRVQSVFIFEQQYWSERPISLDSFSLHALQSPHPYITLSYLSIYGRISTVYPKKTSGRGVIQKEGDTQKEVLAYVFSKEGETDLWQLADAVNPNSVQARPDCLWFPQRQIQVMVNL